MTNPIKVTVPVEGYDVTVSIFAERIRREIERIEQRHADVINEDGSAVLANQIQQFAHINVDISDEKWDELLEIEESSHLP